MHPKTVGHQPGQRLPLVVLVSARGTVVLAGRVDYESLLDRLRGLLAD